MILPQMGMLFAFKMSRELRFGNRDNMDAKWVRSPFRLTGGGGEEKRARVLSVVHNRYHGHLSATASI